MSLADFAVWCDHLPLSIVLRDSTWLFPFIEAFHLLGLALLGGAILLNDFRALGLGLRALPAGDLLREVQPWFLGSLAVTIVSGVLLFLSEATKCYESPAFWLKMAFLMTAIVYAVTIRRWAADRPSLFPGASQLAAVVSIALWLGVGVTGRGIGFW